MDRKTWIRNVLVQKILETYRPWKNAELVGCDVEYIEGKRDNFASCTYCITLHLSETKDGAQIVESHPIFAKFIVEIPSIREAKQSEKQFFNEIVWYSKVVPQFQLLSDASQGKARKLDIFPKCYYTNYDENDAVVALEDLRPKHYCLGDRLALDVQYVEKALEAIARSHALAYRWRETDEESFKAVAMSFKETTINDCMEPVLNLANERFMKYLERDPEYAERVKRFREMTASPVSLMRRLVSPEGSLATICHGDFCRNNILFRKESNGDGALHSILIDFQTPRYASPAIDLSFFFFMSTTPSLRAAEFDRLFKLYYETIISELKALSGEDGLGADRDGVLTLQAFKDDYAAHAVYGYLIASFFLPLMMLDDEALAENTRMWEENDPMYIERFAEIGGVSANLRLGDTLKEILDRGYWPLVK